MAGYRKIIAIFLVVGIATNCFNYWLLATSYAFNKAYISSVLCTNKNKPELHCEGKCFMDIKLKELEQKNKQDQETLKRMIESLAPETVAFLAPVAEVRLATAIPHYLQKKPIQTAVSVFHPPRLG